MINLNVNIKENYSKDGKDLLQLVQEWIDENTLAINCICNLKDMEYR